MAATAQLLRRDQLNGLSATTSCAQVCAAISSMTRRVSISRLPLSTTITCSALGRSALT
jgi:hypothetical protein